ncbi:MAG: universal stress protein [Chloroflexi bacterium]|nr:universal stress protein [Chloroflexota bacterium]MBT6682387.1 universal stress protein [Chloroflexota bacterium]
MSISGILVPLDGAGIAASVLPTVASLARPIRASVHLTAVVDPQKLEIPTLYYQPNVDSSADSDPSKPDSAPLVAPNAQVTEAAANQRIERARVYLGAMASRLQALGIESSYEVFAGDPMTDIVQLARRKRFSLIALSPHSRYAIGRGLGSVTDRVLHSSPIPVLVAPPLSDTPPDSSDLAIQSVIVGLDGSRAAELALGTAAQVAKSCNAQLVLLRAIGGRAGDAAWDIGAERVGRNIEADFRGIAMRYLDEASEQAGMPTTTIVGGEDEVTEILGTAENLPSSLIVLASQGQSGLTKWRLGSVTDRVVRQATRPVIVVPPIMTSRR